MLSFPEFFKPINLKQTLVQYLEVMAGLKEFAGLGGPQLAGLFAVAVLTLCIWRRYLSPISDIPGPFAASFTRLWHIHRILKGDQNLELIRLHNQHGMYT